MIDRPSYVVFNTSAPPPTIVGNMKPSRSAIFSATPLKLKLGQKLLPIFLKRIFLLLVSILLSSELSAAEVTIDGATTYQTIDGFGVNVNFRSWNKGELKPVIDKMIDEGGFTLFRVAHDLSDWENRNDNDNPNSMDSVYYDELYSSADFSKLWGILRYLNSRGITDGAFISFMGWGPQWMMNLDGRSLKPGMESEWAEMITSLLLYARTNQNLQFSMVGANNEPDIFNEGIHVSDATQFARALH